MKNYKRSLVLTAAVLLVIAACKKDGQANNNLTLTDADTGKKLSIASGQKITLMLSDPGDGGYNFDAPQRDSAIIRLDKYEHTAPANGLTGDTGTDSWLFTPLHPGTTILKITATRPWSNGGTIAIFSDTIVVK